jgi:DivIVA domain-containing protein
MDLSPQAVSAATFTTVKKGYDPNEVRTYLNRVSSTLEAAQQQATAMEARARAAIAKMQDLSQQAAAAPAPQARESVGAGTDEAETISRTLLLAQRTADTTVAEAKAEAESVTSAAHSAADTLLAEARAEADRILGEARADARRVKDEELARAEGEVESLLAVATSSSPTSTISSSTSAAQRERVRDVATALQELADRVPGGLGDMRRPLLSASDESGDNERPAAVDAHGGSWSDGDASDERPAVDQNVPFGADKGDLDSPSGEYRHDPTPTAADLTSRAESR